MATDEAQPDAPLPDAAAPAGNGLEGGRPPIRSRAIAIAFVLAIGLLALLRVSGVDAQVGDSVGHALQSLISSPQGCGGG